MEPTARDCHLFVVPPPSALPTGGNVYNEGLLMALTLQGQSWHRCRPEQLEECARKFGVFDSVWIDSLYFGRLSALRAKLPIARRRGLLLHALLSTLARAEGRPDAQLVALEQTELSAFDCALVTSATAAEELAVRAPHLPSWVIEPAVRAAPAGVRNASGQVRALIVANLTPNKGVLPWLEALAVRLHEADDFVLHCLGRADLDPAYANACLHKVRETPALRARVELRGACSQVEVLDALARAHVLISASRVESFGMAIADARASGCVVLARAGGHVGRLVDLEAGGRLVQDDGALAEAFLACVRDRAALNQRLQCASTHRLAERSWQDVAREFVRHAHSRRAAQRPVE